MAGRGQTGVVRIGAGIDLVLNGKAESADRAMGWLLLIWPFSSPAIGTYLSNGERATTITALEEIVAQLKRDQDD